MTREEKQEHWDRIVREAYNLRIDSERKHCYMVIICEHASDQVAGQATFFFPRSDVSAAEGRDCGRTADRESI